MSNFTVEAVFKLVDQFSANAARIQAQTDKLKASMNNLGATAAALKNKFFNLKNAVVGAFASMGVGKALHEAAGEEMLLKKFDFAWKMMKKNAGTTKEDTLNILKSLAKESGMDFEDVAGSVGKSFIQADKITGKNMFRGMRAALDLTAAKGEGTAEELQANADMIVRALAIPGRGLMMLNRELKGDLFKGNAKGLAAFNKAMKDAKDLTSAQKVLLDALDGKFGGARFDFATTLSARLRILKNSALDALSAIGRALDAAIGPGLRKASEGFSEFTEWLDSCTKEAGSFREVLGRMWRSAGKVGRVMLALTAVFVAFKAVMVSAAIVKAVWALAAAFGALIAAMGPIGWIIAGIGAAILGLAAYYDIGIQDVKKWGSDFAAEVRRTIADIGPDLEDLGQMFYNILPQPLKDISDGIDRGLEAVVNRVRSNTSKLKQRAEDSADKSAWFDGFGSWVKDFLSFIPKSGSDDANRFRANFGLGAAYAKPEPVPVQVTVSVKDPGGLISGVTAKSDKVNLPVGKNMAGDVGTIGAFN